jgi:hypothetical protein
MPAEFTPEKGTVTFFAFARRGVLLTGGGRYGACPFLVCPSATVENRSYRISSGLVASTASQQRAAST